MTRRCELTGKSVQSGNNVSHANNRTRRRFLPNLHPVSLYSDVLKKTFKFRASAYAIRCVEHRGGLDLFLAKASDDLLSLKAQRVKRQITKVAAS